MKQLTKRNHKMEMKQNDKLINVFVKQSVNLLNCALFKPRHRRSQGGTGGSPPRIQDWQSTKNRRLEGPISYVLFTAFALQKTLNLSSQKTPKFTILRSKTKTKTKKNF